MAVKRIFVKKKNGFDIAAKAILHDLQENLGISGLLDVAVLIRYDVEGMSETDFEKAVVSIFSEPMVDDVFLENHTETGVCFTVEYLPGQYDQRADSAAQCVQLLTMKVRPTIAAATVYALTGDLTEADITAIQSYIINPVDSRLADEAKRENLDMDIHPPEPVPQADGFLDFDDNQLKKMVTDFGFAMKFEDLKLTQSYFKEEGRDPYISELRVIDTYWSDHCRHTTFLTQLDEIIFGEGKTNVRIKKAYDEYLSARKSVYIGRKEKDICLMDMATIYAKFAKKQGLLKDLDESEEINACSIKKDITVSGEKHPYLIMFKNETHNHPTEIEPFGGAATCLGGAIRDPLSGRAYVYQAMRVTGAGDVTEPLSKALENKLPQKKITTEAAHGYSSYGNQIGLATGLVDEIYHPGYKAKRMEIGAVIAAVPAENVVRERPEKGDIVLMLGGRTGRDGIGGATGSSKSHDDTSISECGAEVQKGNPLTERKLQRLFRNPDFSKRIKRCNDFGAGGVCVAVGELTDGLDIDLDAVPKKYEGLNGTELCISESQERMAVVINVKDLNAVLKMAKDENLEAVKIADVTDTARMRMRWNGETIVDISRALLDTNGVTQHARAKIDLDENNLYNEETKENAIETLKSLLSDINIASKKGLIERFDSTIGAATVNMPLGGNNQLTPVQAMAAKVPIAGGLADTATLMSYGYDPYLTEKNPFIGSIMAVVSSAAKLVASGGDLKDIWLTFQEYFERMTEDPKTWGKPTAALLGAFYAQKNLGIAAIGGKDSMSGTFNDIHVPPTLVSFAVTTQEAKHIVSGEFKGVGSNVYRLSVKTHEDGIPDFDDLKKKYDALSIMIKSGKVKAAYALERGGAGVALAKMCFGNGIGFTLDESIDRGKLFNKAYADILIETDETLNWPLMGKTGGNDLSFGDESVSLDDLKEIYLKPLAKVFPHTAGNTPEDISTPLYQERNCGKATTSFAKPRVILPVFAGTNCEYDSMNAFNEAGGQAEHIIINNLSPKAIEDSIDALVKKIGNAQIIMLPGGFSGGDEPDGSGKFIATTFRNPKVKDAVHDLLFNRDGLMLGICNGFQALIKLGLLTKGKIADMEAGDPTLTFNTIGRHISRLVTTRVTSVNSPWMSLSEPGEIHTVAVSHGEGRFVASEADIAAMIKNGQIATQYVGPDGLPTMDGAHNVNGSMFAVEGVFSADGRVFGKMGHNERSTENTFKNVPGNKDKCLFQAGINYYK